MLYCGQELINGNFATAFLPPPPIYYAGPPRNLSPPWRPDDKDGHYVFALGDNLTPRCMFSQHNILFSCLHWLLFLDTFYVPLAALGDVSVGEVSISLNITTLHGVLVVIILALHNCFMVQSSHLFIPLNHGKHYSEFLFLAPNKFSMCHSHVL